MLSYIQATGCLFLLYGAETDCFHLQFQSIELLALAAHKIGPIGLR